MTARAPHRLLVLLVVLATALRAGCSAASPYGAAYVPGAAVGEEAAAAALAKRHGAAAARQQRAASLARWNSSVVIVVTWHNRSIDWLAKYSPAHVSLALYIKGGPYTCRDVPSALQASVAHCEKGGNADGREAHTMALFLTRWYGVLPRVTMFSHDNDDERLHPLRNLTSLQLHAWARAVEAQSPPLFRSRSTCLCVNVTETHWRRYGPRKPALAWFMQHVLGFANASDRWASLAYPPGATLAVPARAVLSRPKLVYEVIYALTNGTEEVDPAAVARGTAMGRPQLSFRSWENGNQRQWAPFSWAHNFERLWVRAAQRRAGRASQAHARSARAQFAIFDVDYNPDGWDAAAA